MSFDRETRNILARTVTSCRRLLTDDVTEQMGGTYGLHSDGTELSIEKLTHLPPDKLAIAREFRELLNYYEAKESGNNKRLAAYNRIILETSFTILNRLVALRMSEDRKLIIESVVKGYASDGFRLFEQLSGGTLGSSYETYCIYLECLFDEVALDLGILFDRSTPQSKIFPTENCLTAVLAEINKVELKELWKEDETIGWVYQYFNPQEERKAMRDESQAPRNSRELAVRNQFFTPRYVVEFLTDNTLGRTWYEMRQGETILKENCNYLVRRPNEIFLSKGEKAPTDYENETELSQGEILKQPVYIENRPKKDPRDIKVLDPACGSGHFLLYAFDLLEQIYLEAWEDQESPVSEATGKTLHEDYETADDLRSEVPALIVRWNLYGIDIDQRAVQIAALALWLRAQKSWLGLGLKPYERPHISKSNIVTAEPMPGDDKMRQEFIETLQPRLLGQIVNVIFEKMKLAGEAGSLLKIEEEIAEVVSRAKEQWLKRPKLEQNRMFVDSNDLKQGELEFDLSDVTDEAFWGQAESSIFEALKGYSEGAESGNSLKRRMFKEDAAGGFAFIDLCRNRYDVVLMNPPFGAISLKNSHYIQSKYPTAKSNIACCFIDRVADFALSSDIGVIIDNATSIRSSYEPFRRNIIFKSNALTTYCILGWSVLDDANVETCCYTFSNHGYYGKVMNGVWCIDLSDHDDKGSILRSEVEKTLLSKEAAGLIVYQKEFESYPNGILTLGLPKSISKLFITLKSLDPNYGNVCTGLSSGDNSRFYKLYWEINPKEINKEWFYLSNGGEYSPAYRKIVDVIDWRNDGSNIRAHKGAFIRNEKKYKIAGLTYGKRGNFLSVQFQNALKIFTNEGQCIYPVCMDNINVLCALLNSSLLQFLINTYCGQHKENGYVKLLPISSEIINNTTAKEKLSDCIDVVYKTMWNAMLNSLEHAYTYGCSYLRDIALSNVTLRDIFQAYNSALNEYASCASLKLHEIDDIIFEHYKINKVDIALIKQCLSEKPKPIKVIQSQTVSSITDFIEEMINYVIGILFGRWDCRYLFDNKLINKSISNKLLPIPICPPGMLLNPSGLPAEPGNIVSEEWLRARPDAYTLPPEGSVKNPTIKDEDYPLRISWEGILVDDPGIDCGQPHREDIVGRVREVLGVIWQDKAGEIEEEACDFLGVSDLRDYFRKPSGFFQDHLKRYSKSRRKAPIYWPLSTTSGSYTLWIYYHRLNDQTLYTAVNRYVEPKIDQLERAIDRIEVELAGGKGINQAGLKERQRKHSEFLTELKEFRDELLRVSGLPYKPNLNDGVIINAAPLHKLFGLRPWAKDTAECWKKLEKGEYDWAHMAFTLWPERVKEKSKIDRSLAIAHDL